MRSKKLGYKRCGLESDKEPLTLRLKDSSPCWHGVISFLLVNTTHGKFFCSHESGTPVRLRSRKVLSQARIPTLSRTRPRPRAMPLCRQVSPPNAQRGVKHTKDNQGKLPPIFRICARDPDPASHIKSRVCMSVGILAEELLAHAGCIRASFDGGCECGIQ